MHTETNEKHVGSTTMCVCAYVFLHKLFRVCTCVSVGLLGTGTIEIQIRPFSKAPLAITVLALDDFAEFHVPA